jgi:hypothetical protein
MINGEDTAINIFYAYAHEDKKLLDALETHLSLLKHQRLIEGWHDCDISAGKEWKREINVHLNTAQIILLLVSPHFLASEYCYSTEMQRALERHEAGETRVIPILLRPVDWHTAPFSKLQILPKNAQAVTSWRKRDEAFANIAQEIRVVVQELMTDSQQILATSLNSSKIDTALSRSALTFPSLPPAQLHPQSSDIKHQRNRFLLLGIALSFVLIAFMLFPRLQQGLIGTSPTKTNQASTGLSTTSCPAFMTANVVNMPSLQLHRDQSLIYATSNHTTPSSSILRYNVNTRSKTEILTIKDAIVNESQLSRDKQWLLFTAEGSGQNKLQMVRVDGQYLQTIYCSPQAEGIFGVRLSHDQKWLAFSVEGPDIVMYLLNLTSGVLQPMLIADKDFFVAPYDWIDATHLYVAEGGRAPSCPCTQRIYSLDITQGMNQHTSSLKQIIDISDTVHIKYEFDSKQLFINRCCKDYPEETGPTGSTISVRPATEYIEKNIFSDPKLDIISILAISAGTIFFHVENLHYEASIDYWVSDPKYSGIWRVGLDGSGLKRLVAFNKPNIRSSLEVVVSDNGKMYIQITYNEDKSESLLLGSMNADSPIVIETVSNSSLSIVGWATI